MTLPNDAGEDEVRLIRIAEGAKASGSDDAGLKGGAQRSATERRDTRR